MPETPDPLADLIDDLSEQARETRKWMAYYDGDQPLTYIAHELVRELDNRIKSVVINWPELVVDSLEERLDVEGFRLPGADQGDERLWEWWQANDLDGESGAAHVEALAAGRSFVIVGANDDGDFPLITVESSEQVYAEIDERTRKVRQAVKAWSEDGMDYATLYQPDRTSFWMRSGPSGESWREYAEADEHGKGIVPVVPIVNRRRTMRSMGRSELTSIVPLSDAACKIATDMMVSAEFHAMPRRWVVGASEEDFHDAEGRPLTKWSKIAGRVWTIEGDELGNTPQVGQFPEAQLSNFHSTLHTLAQLAASVAGLPSDFFGQSTDNPASAEARRAGLERLIKRAERRQRTFGGQWEQVMRIATLWQTGEVAPEMARLETIWRDPATPTRGQVADAAVKLHAEGITTKRQAREDVGYSDAQIKRMEDEDAKAVDRVLAGDLSALVGPKPTPVPPAA